MRILLLLSVTCMGYAMENQAINTEAQPLLARQIDQENHLQNCVIYCWDHHGGMLIMCGSLLCMGGLAVAGCWHAGGMEAIRSSSAIARVMQ